MTTGDKAALTQSVEGMIDRPVWMGRRYAPQLPENEDREQSILDFAARLLADGIDDPELARREFGVRFGSGGQDDFSTQITVIPLPGRGVRVLLDLTSVTDWRAFVGSRFGDPISPEWRARAEDAFRDRSRQRSRHREPATITRALAVHYLSLDGGGTLSLGAAAARYSHDERCSIHDPESSWDASWHGKIIAQLVSEYGPLP
ncbi:MAG: hypothetical protein ACR2I5_13970 [Candidatus Limnocylindria bacterium]